MLLVLYSNIPKYKQNIVCFYKRKSNEVNIANEKQISF